MDTKVLKNVYIWFIGAFLMPPMAWLFLAWFAQIWNFSELIQDSPAKRLGIPKF